MRIQHIDPDVSVLSHDGKEYPVTEEGVFDVPHDVASQLIQFPHWRTWDGNPWPREKSAAELEAERIAGLVKVAVEALQTPAPAKKPDRLAAARAALSKKKQGKK
jgi:hypothetical protein